MRWPLLDLPFAPLLPGTVHLAFADPAAPKVREAADAYFSLLSTEERARHARFLFPRDRELFLVSHALTRLTLSRAHPLPPAAWEFHAGPHGRPEPLLPEGAPALRFNLSHTDGLVMCALTVDHRVGADVEGLSPHRGTREIAERFFSPPEIACLATDDREAARRRFFELWTLKEAFIKAVGAGLTMPLDRFGFEVAGEAIDVWFEPVIGEDPRDWRFWLYAPTSNHRAALALAGAQAAAEVHARWTVPGLEDLPLPPEPVATTARSRASRE